MRFHFQHACRAVILLAFSGLIVKLHVNGEIAKYINVKYSAFSQIASVLLVFLFFIQVKRIWTVEHGHDHDCSHQDCGHDHGTPSKWSLRTIAAYVILAVPLLTGFFLPAKTLDASMASKKGIMYSQPNSTGQTSQPIQEKWDKPSPPDSGLTQNPSVEQDPQTADQKLGEDPVVYFDDLYQKTINELLSESVIQIKDEQFVSYADTITLYPELFKGKQIELVGFVYKEEGMQDDEMVVARFIITHCIADAGVIGFLVKMDGVHDLEPDTWVKVHGVLDTSLFGDFEIPVIKANRWEKVQAPKDPYVYP